MAGKKGAVAAVFARRDQSERRGHAERCDIDTPSLSTPAAARRASSTLRLGTWEALPAEALAFRRWLGVDVRLVLVNFGELSVACPIEGAWRVEAASDAGGEDHPYRDQLGAEQTPILR